MTRLSTYKGDLIDIALREVRNTDQVFWSKHHNSYVIVPSDDFAGQWVLPDGQRVALLSIHGNGEVRWFVDSSSESTDGDYDAMDYFKLRPFDPKAPVRRRAK